MHPAWLAIEASRLTPISHPDAVTNLILEALAVCSKLDARCARSRRMIRKHAVRAGITAPIGNHTFRATGITNFLENGGTLEHAQDMAAHASPRTTRLYDRRQERITQAQVERIRL